MIRRFTGGISGGDGGGGGGGVVLFLLLLLILEGLPSLVDTEDTEELQLS